MRGTQRKLTIERFAVVPILFVITLAALGCAPSVPSPTPLSSHRPTVAPTVFREPTPTATQPPVQEQEVEGLVIVEDGQVIIGVGWLKSRAVYRVTGGDVERVRALEGETVQVRGTITDHGPQLKEIAVTNVRVSAKTGGLSRRVGYIKELGMSIYMQGTHVLTDREGQTICLLSPAEGGPGLDQYMLAQVAVIGVLENTVEGNAKIMKVQRVEIVK